MMQKKQWIMLVVLLTAYAVPKVQAVEEGKLLVWINGDKPYTALQQLGDQFAKDTGIPVTVEHPDHPENKFAQAAQAGRGPDLIIWAHDRLGGWAQSGLIQPVSVDDAYKAGFSPKAWDAVTYGGKMWGYPITMECVTLIYNKKLIKSVPATLDEVCAMAKKDPTSAVLPILWAYDTPYFTWPFLAGAGGYVYGRDASGNYNMNDIGVNTDGAVKALQYVAGMITQGIMPRSATYDVMISKMMQGTLDMMVTGPWEWNNLRKNNIDFGVAVIPGVGGPAKPFVGVLTAMLDAKTPNQDLAEMFLKQYVLTVNGLKALNDDTFDGPPALIEAYNQQKADPNVEASMKNVDLGDLMPNIPQMGVFWSALEAAVKTVTSGQSDAKTALDNAAANMKNENAK
ncbi:MAG: maltose/maltodextrin ABC transporter substrate-binding protein MalE [Kiritimatiellae bacterium]|nr:maltose/maltodextrin ABC transporter substrate-binding protein MalE [Kiritimatiellia bacterium]MDD4735368.1 maltose/maltodextrin ABC transporter substrate-binding protein MalE [Kiritimatiellia bacterium]